MRFPGATRADPGVRLSRAGLLPKVERDQSSGLGRPIHLQSVRRLAASVTHRIRHRVRGMRRCSPSLRPAAFPPPSPPPTGLSSDWGDYSATSMIGVRWKPARRRRPVQNPPQFSIPQPAAIRAIIPLPPRSPNLWTLPLFVHQGAVEPLIAVGQDLGNRWCSHRRSR